MILPHTQQTVNSPDLIDGERVANFEFTPKQWLALMLLQDDHTKELLFGGAAGGGKSLFGCMWAIGLCMQYKDIRGFFAREELKSLKESTLLTFFDACKILGLQEGVHYKYYTDSRILFLETGSEIYLKELKFYPSDPDYDYLGSTEYTFGFIDEASQITSKAKNVMLSRIRYKLNEYGLTPKLLMTCNPHKGWLYGEFFLPDKRDELPAYRAFIKALPGDNPMLPESYIDTLRSLDKQTRERLLYGNWEYDEDPATLCEYDALEDLFTNHLEPIPLADLNQYKYIIADIARFGDDRTVVSYWEGWKCVRIASYTKLPVVPDKNQPGKISSAEVVEKWRQEFRVPLSRVLVDEDGVGGGAKDYLGCRGFMARRKTFNKKLNYDSIKDQCGYVLAGKVNQRLVRVVSESPKLREYLIEEMGQLKAWERDKDKKIKIMPKEQVKKHIGRSPDFSDVLLMRAYFEILPVQKITSVSVG